MPVGGHWSVIPRKTVDSLPGHRFLNDDGQPLQGSNKDGCIVALGAVCGQRDPANQETSVSGRFWVCEFAELSTGRKIALRDCHGFTLSRVINSNNSNETECLVTQAQLIETVLAILGPDPDDGEAHPWELLASLALQRHALIPSQGLENCTYTVVLTDDVIDWCQCPIG